MKRTSGIVLGTLGFASLACIGMAMAQSGNPPRPVPQQSMAVERVQDSRMIALSLVRFLNTAEADYKAKEGSYANWEELENSAYFLAGKSRWAQSEGVTINSGPDVIPGWTLALVVSSDRRDYQLSLHQNADKQCRFSFFSDQSGIIYQGGAIDCSVELVPV
jgi:hypothetical protein